MTNPEAADSGAYDVAVVGGGVVGASAAQNLAAQGFRTVLLEQGDFASGTSSRSSRLLYCGLAHFSPDYPLWRLGLHPRDFARRVRMARLAMLCRTELATTMPERHKACDFVFPVLKDSRYPAWKVALGYRALGVFGSRRAPLNYRHVRMPRAAEENGLVALMDPARVTGVAAFREYQYDWPERICIDTVLDAERLGATVRNYARVTRIANRAGHWHLSLAEGPRPGCPGTGGAAVGEVRARFLVNAAGPWVDRVLDGGTAPKRRHVIGIKGVNVLVRLPEACRGKGFETISSKDQPFYLMPWGDHHFFGPTETVFEGPPEDARVLPEELDYILGEANRVLPSLRLTRADVVYAWCGVRPRTAGGDEGQKSVTLHDMAAEGLPNALTVTGSPIMVHRYAGREVAAAVGRRLQASGPPQPLSSGARLLPWDEAGGMIGGVPRSALRAAAGEHVATLLDLMFRRVNMGWQPDLGLPHARAVAREVADLMAWDAAAIDAEVAAYRAFVTDNFLQGELAEAEKGAVA